MDEDSGAKRRTGRRPKTAESGRTALLRAAMHQFSRKGYDGTSLRAVADEAGVDMALINRLFGSKAGLWSAMIDLAATHESRAAALRAIKDDTGMGVRQRLELFIDVIVDVAIDLPVFPGLLLQEASTPGERMDMLIDRLIGPFGQDAMPLIEDGIRQKVIADVAPSVFFSLLMSSVTLAMAAPHHRRMISTDPVELAEIVKAAAKAIFLR
ncbi:TetR/AcrR family transcriptional regulator [Pleomorphomonas sp. PLEO]|uniref:TetR/AcrR family transcriptional regulator n=1 Tax=Pleomorphomonas sp. PLEO TaxID=3239306 RepID=UPI00351E0FE2